jgi:hypothetical protein
MGIRATVMMEKIERDLGWTTKPSTSLAGWYEMDAPDHGPRIMLTEAELDSLPMKEIARRMINQAHRDGYNEGER